MKHRGTIPILAAMIVAAGCQKESLIPECPGKVTLTAGVVTSAPGTRAMGETADIRSLTVIVFDESGCFTESARATELTPGAGAAGDETEFKVTLTATSEPVTLHLVANHDPGNIAFGVESEVLGLMSTSGGQEAYWQRVELPGGIPSDGTIPAEMRRIPLTRNFAAVTLDSTADNFTLTGFALTNIPSGGSVAPHTSTGGFAPYGGETCPGYEAIHATGYRGWVPAGTELLNTTGESLTFTTGTIYTYEHPYTANKDTYTSVIVKGRKTGMDHDTYYKLDLTRVTGSGTTEYYDIIRNIRYAITLTSVAGKGHETAQEAMDSPAGNNITGSVNTDEMDNISDGTGQLFVSETSLEFVTRDAQTFRFRWIPDIIAAGQVTRNDLVTVNAPEGAVLESSSVSGSDTDGWRTVTLTPKAIGNLTRTQDITLTTPTGLSKTIHLKTHPKYNMTVTASPSSVARVTGTQVAIGITIPAGLPKSMFPLKMTVSTDDNTLYPDPSRDSMPLEITTPTYGFTKTIGWTAYETATGDSDTMTITCHFLTNTKDSATTVRVRETRFNDGTAAITN